MDGELWKIASVQTSSSLMLAAFNSDGIKWAQDVAASHGKLLVDLGAECLSESGNQMVETRSPVVLATRCDAKMLQLSADVRIAFAEEAMEMSGDESEEDDI
mmetsp:Transcript_72166/g.116388  ORF Transcript_72166/g.116388 Transcript_72166/m.116388 type:complete len:102 (+) Transcript_72166:171-476(+)